MSGVEAQLEEIKRKLDETATLRRIEDGVNEMRRQLEDVDEKVCDLSKKIDGDGDGKSGLTGRVTSLEHKVDAGIDNKRANIALVVAIVAAVGTVIAAVINKIGG